MKKNNNIKQLKEIVNNDLFFDLHHQGVQAYNISANEYEVITGFRKCNGRYYFIDRNRNKYLASRYDRADFIAGEMLEQKERRGTGERSAASFALVLSLPVSSAPFLCCSCFFFFYI